MKYLKLTICSLFYFCLFSCKKEIPQPIANFNYSIDKKQITFKNSSTNSNSFEWDFGDGMGKSTEKEPSYSYKSPGTYKVTLKVLGLGGENEIQKTIDISAIKPKAAFSFIVLVNGGLKLVNESLDAESFIWEIEEIGLDTIRDPKLVFSFNGNYKIKLKAIGFGATDETEQTISITNSKERPPLVDFTFQDLGQGKYKFINKSLHSNTFNWDFGDGKGKATAENPEYFFQENGIYKVKLTCTGLGGVKSKDSIITVTSSFNYYNYVLENKSNYTLIAYNNDKSKPLQNFDEVSISPNSKTTIRVKAENGIIPMIKSLNPDLILEYSTTDNKNYILSAYLNLYEIKFTGTCEPINIITNIRGQKETFNSIPLPYSIGVKIFNNGILDVQSFKNNASGFLNVFVYFKDVLIKIETISDPFADILIQYDTSKKQFYVKETSPEEWYCGSYNGNRLITGPKGGCYYNNSNGNKTYVDRGFCNCN